MRKLFFGVLFISLAFISNNYFLNLENAQKDEVKSKFELFQNKQFRDYEERKLLNRAKRISDLVNITSSKLTPYVNLKRATFLFEEAEDCLKKAAEIENAVDMSNKKGLHPLTSKMLDKALTCYELARKEIEKAQDIDDSDFNYHSNYLKGEIYYRFLEFMSDPETVREMFNQTVTYYKQALRFRPGDVNTVVNIELLIKNEAALTGSGDPQLKKKQMLKKFANNKSSGN